MSKLFRVENQRRDGKEITLISPSSELRITVDNDDVDRSESIPLLERMLTILNDHWNSPKYAHLAAMERENDDYDGEAIYESARKRLEKLFKDFR